MKFSYKQTRLASYGGYITQAIVNNFAPLLFVFFRKSFGLTVAQLGFIIAYNFVIQIIVDLISAGLIDKIGTKKSVVYAHIFAFAGLLSLAFFPFIMSNKFLGMICSVTLYAIGGGIIEVLVSPIVESLPSDDKAGKMSLLHSFYCWGHAGVVIISTLFFTLFGVANWRALAVVWSLFPLANAFFFMKCPLPPVSHEEERDSFKKISKNKLFWAFFLLMLCAGASEQAVSQWSSYFAQTGLNVSKTMGDLLGTLMFTLLMGTARAFYGKFSEKLDLEKFIFYSSLLCIGSYLLLSLSPIPALSLFGCGLCGLSVGIMWPGVFSMSAKTFPGTSTAMYAILALAGDIGCSAGPAMVGQISQAFNGNLKTGILASMIFPVTMVVFVKIVGRAKVE